MNLFKTYLPLLHNRDYLKLMLANITNRFGDNIDAIALSWLIYDISKNPSYSAINFGINMLPGIVFQPLLGPIVEKRNKKWILVCSDVARGLCIFTLFLLYLSNRLNAIHILVITFFMSTFESFRLPASSAILPELLEEEDYVSGVAFSNSLSKTVELIGLGSAGVIIAIGGMESAILIDVLSFAISAILLCSLSTSKKCKCTEKEAYLQSLKEGISYVLDNRPLVVLMISACLLNASLVPYNSFESVIISDFYHKGISVLSYTSLCITLSMLIGSLLFPIINQKMNLKQTLFICFFSQIAFYTLILLAMQIHNTVLFYLIITLKCFLLGFPIALANNFVNVMMMRVINPNYMARVMAVNHGFGTLLVPILSFLLSAFSTYLSIPIIIIIFIFFLLSVILYFWKKDLLHHFKE